MDLPDGIEQEVKVWVIPQAGTSLSAETVFLHCAENMPYFMIPRFIELTEKLPKTHTQRTMKYQLREAGNGDATWDRANVGYRVGRDSVTRHGERIVADSS